MSKRNRKFHDPRQSRQVTETGKWVEQKKGQIFAPGTYVDAHGVLRASSDGSCAVWHHNARQRAEMGLTGSCERRGIRPDQIAYDPQTGAPWCDECWPHEQKRQAFEQSKRFEAGVKKLFGDGN